MSERQTQILHRQMSETTKKHLVLVWVWIVDILLWFYLWRHRFGCSKNSRILLCVYNILRYIVCFYAYVKLFYTLETKWGYIFLFGYRNTPIFLLRRSMTYYRLKIVHVCWKDLRTRSQDHSKKSRRCRTQV